MAVENLTNAYEGWAIYLGIPRGLRRERSLGIAIWDGDEDGGGLWKGGVEKEADRKEYPEEEAEEG